MRLTIMQRYFRTFVVLSARVVEGGNRQWTVEMPVAIWRVLVEAELVPYLTSKPQNVPDLV